MKQQLNRGIVRETLKEAVANGEIYELYTHGGTFHADDIFCCALIELCHPNPEYIGINRVFKNAPETSIAEGILTFDVGGGKYDHHQPDAEVRPNGVKYASFGLLWRELGSLLVSEKRVEEFDEVFVQAIDYTDNTGDFNPLSVVISNMNLLWDEERNPVTETQAFNKALNFAKDILAREVERLDSKDRAENIVRAAIESASNGIAVLEKFVHGWQEQMIPEDIQFVIFPSLRGGYNVQVVPKELGKQDAKIPFPQEWAGLRDTEIQEVSGIKGLSFCHMGRFLCACDTIETAKEVVKKTLCDS